MPGLFTPLLALALVLGPSFAYAQATHPPVRTIQLYAGAVPGALGSGPGDRPSVDVYLPAANPTRTAVLIIPGGGYTVVVDDREGARPAQWLVERGIAAFVLHYRVAPYRYPVEIEDGRRAMRLLRGEAAQLGFAPDHLGVWGFSAGGHLASTLATLFDAGIAASPDPVDHESDRPDFAVLAYPVISMKDGIVHPGSLHALLGPQPDPAMQALLSAEDHVTPQSPPAFLFATNDDPVVPVANSMLYAAACQRAQVPVELHIFEHGRHGIDLAEDDPVLRQWTVLLEAWMRANRWIAAADGATRAAQ